jgi:hypothetical protein
MAIITQIYDGSIGMKKKTTERTRQRVADQKILFGTEILIEVDMADDVLALHPPLALEIILISIFPMLVNHTAIRT